MMAGASAIVLACAPALADPAKPDTKATAKPAPRKALPAPELIEASGIRRAFTHASAQHLPDSDTRVSAERLTERGVVDLRGLE